MRKLLWGISGIGTGHSNRQLPIIEHFAKDTTIAILAYNESYHIYSQKYKDHPNVIILPIDIPFIAGNKDGLDFEETAKANKGKDFTTINSLALARAQQVVGKPDLVVTDYEPLSAQYAYATGAPLVTLDQQSKYLCGEFPKFEGQGYRDEIMRLNMFFPKADARLACSFFNVDTTHNPYDVQIVPSTIKDQVTQLQRKEGNSILLYVSSQREFVQSLDDVLAMCQKRNEHFDIFLRTMPNVKTPKNVTLYEHGDPKFYDALSTCKGIISTAGHMLLSEAMYLGIPVYAIPLGVYEQHMNAHILESNDFGISRPQLDETSLDQFIENISRFKSAIESDRDILLRRPGQQEIILKLEDVMRGRL